MSAKRRSARPVASVRGWNPPEWLIRTCLLVFSPVLFVLLSEASLRLFGYGDPSSFFVRGSGESGYVTNERFARQFSTSKTQLRPFLFTIPAQKATNTIRICILGESAAMGTPDPAFGMPRMLEAQLRSVYPKAAFEVLNAAMRGINSYAIRKIARELAGHEVDVFVVYMGNNDMVGLHGPLPGTPAWAQSLPVLRLVDWVKTFRAGQLLASWIESEPSTQDMDYFRSQRLRADDPRKSKARENFRANLRDVCDAATSRGARVLLCTVAVNLKDCPPLGSLHRKDWSAADQTRWDELYSRGSQFEIAADYVAATNSYGQALALDPSYAELHFRLARCLEQLGDRINAAREYQLACDWDTLQFRTDSAMNAIIREEATARQHQGVVLADMAREFAESPLSDGGVPGEKLFLEHVHPTFAGNFLLASAAQRAVEPLLAGRIGGERGEPLTQEQCADWIGYTPYDHVNVIAAITRLCAGPPFLDQLEHPRRQAVRELESRRLLTRFDMEQAERAMRTYRVVLAREPHFWPTRLSLATLLTELKRYPEAVGEFRTLIDLYPDYPRFRLACGNALLSVGQREEALAEFTRALRLQPKDPNVRQLVAKLNKR